MPLYGKIVVVKRNGTDGTHFPLTANSCLFGRKRECDIRIQLPQVSKEHCKIEVNENKEVILFNLSSTNPTQVNGSSITEPTYLKHGDILNIIDRSFRFEYPPVSIAQKRHSRSQEKDTLQVLHVQQDVCAQDSEVSTQIPDKEFEWRSQTPNGSKKRRSKEHITRQNGASECKICQSERRDGISFSSEFSESVIHEDATKIAEGNSETCNHDNFPRKDGNAPEGVSEMPNRRPVANLTNTDAIMQKGVSQVGSTGNQSVIGVISSPVHFDVNKSRKSSTRRSSEAQSYASLQNSVTKQKESNEDTNPLTIQHTEENEPEKSKEIKSACSAVLRQSKEYLPESCYIVQLDCTDGMQLSQTSVDQTVGASVVGIKPILTDSSGSDESALSTPKVNKKCFQVYSSPFTGNNKRKSSSKYRMPSVELDTLIEMPNCADASIEIEECSPDGNTGESETNILPTKYSKGRRKSKEMAIELVQALEEQKNEIGVNYTPKDGNSGIACSLCTSNDKSPMRSAKQNKDTIDRISVMKITTEESVIISNVSEMSRTILDQPSDDNFDMNCPGEQAEKIKQPIIDTDEQNINIKTMPVFSNLHERNVQMSVEAVSTMNMLSPCRSNRKSEIKKSPQKRKNDMLFQTSGKRKRVSFGSQLSPELFDKRLPPNSPLKKGAIPARLSLPSAKSPRAVLKKAELRRSVIKGLSEREQDKNILFEKPASSPFCSSPAATTTARRSPAASTTARRSPSATTPARRSPAASTPARRSPGATTPARRSPAASTPARRSPGATTPARRSPDVPTLACFSCDSPQRKGRFSVSCVSSPSPGEQNSVSKQVDVNKELTELKTCEPTEQESKASRSVRRSKIFPPRRNSLRRRSGAMDAIQSKRRSGASEANLIVAKSWADVVKQGIPKSQSRTTATKCGLKRNPAKKPIKPSKNNSSTLQIPIRKLTGHITTGHANSPAPIVVGKAHIRIMKSAVEVPKVMYNYPLRQHSDLNESFTGLAEMFSTPEKSLLSSETKKMSTQEAISETHNEVAEEKATLSNQHYREETLSSSFKKKSSISTLGQEDLQITPRGANGAFGKTMRKDSLMVAVSDTAVIGMQDKSQEQKSETVRMLSGIKRLLETPKPKADPVEAPSGVKKLLRTPKRKPEPVEVLSGIKRLLRTPKQKPEPIEALSGVRRLLKTPKQKPEPVEALLGVKRLLRTPKQKMEPVEVLSGIKNLLKTPKQNLECVAEDITSSKVMKSPEQMSKELMGHDTERKQKHRMQAKRAYAVEDPEKKVNPVEDLEGIQWLFRSPKQKTEPVEDLFGVSQLLKTPKQRFLPVNDFLGLQKLMAEPKQNCLSPEIDYSGIKEMLETGDKQKGELPEVANLIGEENESYVDFRNENESMGNEPENKEEKLEDSTFSVQTDGHKHDPKSEDTTRHVLCNTVNELKTETDKEAIETKCGTSKVKQTQSYQPDEINFQNGATIDFVKGPTVDQGPVDKEVTGVLTLGRRTRRQKVNESSSIKEPTKQILRYTRSSSRANSNAAEVRTYQKTGLSPVQESEASESAMKSVKRSLRGTSRKHFTETAESVICDGIGDSQESLVPSNKVSVKVSPCPRRRMASKQKGKAEATLDLKQDKKVQETACPLAAKILLNSNREDDQNGLKSELSEVNIQDKVQNEDVESSGMENIENGLKKRRGKNAQIQTKPEKLNADVDEYKIRHKKCISKSCKKEILENITEVKENNVKQRKRGKVHFMLENNYFPLQEKSALGDNSGSTQEERTALFETITTATIQHTSRSKRKTTSVATQPVCSSLSKAKQALEISEAECRQSTNLSSENILEKGNASGVNFGFAKEDDGEECQIGESPDETQKMLLESEQTSARNSCLRRQKVAKESVPRRGRKQQAICKEISTQYDSKQTAEMKKEHTEEKQPKRGRKRKIVPQLEISLPLEHIALEGRDLKKDSLSSAQGEYSTQQIQNKPYLNEIQKITSKSAPITAEHSSPKRQKVVKEIPLKRSKRKGFSHETIAENDKKQGDLVDQNKVRNEDLPKFTKRRRIASELQIPLFLVVSSPTKEVLEMSNSSSAKKKSFLKQTQSTVIPKETQKVAMENVQVPAEHSLPEVLNRTKDDPPRGRRRKAIAQKTHREYDSKQTDKEQDVVAKNGCSAKENQLKWGRGQKIAPVSPVLLSPLQKNFPLRQSARSKRAVEQPSESSEIEPIANRTLSHRGRRTDGIIATDSVSASKKPRLLDKSKKEKPRDIPDVSKENISTRSRRKQLVLPETLVDCNGQLENYSKKAILVTDENVPLRKGSGKENQSKKKTREQIAAPSQISSSLTLPPLSSDIGGAVCENQALTENGAVRKGRVTKSGSRNNKKVARIATVRGKNKETEEIDHKNDVEKTAMKNEKWCRNERNKLAATICASLKENYGSDTASDTASKDLLTTLGNTAAKDKPNRRGRRRQVNNDSETSATISDTTGGVVLEDKLKSKTENSENTTLQKEKRKKMKGEHTRATATVSAEETEGRTRRSKRTKK